jgi:DNA-binding transcriptional ArsR family regulator
LRNFAWRSNANASTRIEVIAVFAGTGLRYCRRQVKSTQDAAMTKLDARISFPAAMLADQTREAMVMSLMDGRAYTSKELAYRAHVTPQTASFHLKKMVEAQLLLCHCQGRHAYYRINGPDVAAAIEALVRIAPTPGVPAHLKRSKEPFLFARRCYDHLAGRLGVAVAEQVAARELVALTGIECRLTDKGNLFFQEMGLDVARLQKRRRSFLRPCIDCTERKPHLAGVLAAAMLDHFTDEGWVASGEQPRTLEVTPIGKHRFAETFSVAADALKTAI